MRILTTIILCILAFILPWWLVFGLAIIGCFVWSSYYEAIIVGLVIDSLYNAPIARFGGFQFVLTASAIVAFIIIEFLRSKLRFYN